MAFSARRIKGADIVTRIKAPKPAFKPLAVLDEGFDRRRHRRVETELQCRFRAGGEWYHATAQNLSAGGAAVRSEMRPTPFSWVMFRIRGVGIVRALVMDWQHDGFRVKFQEDDVDTEAVVDALTVTANRRILLMN